MLINALNDIWTALRSFDEQALTFASWAVLIYVFVIITVNMVKKLRHREHDGVVKMLWNVFKFGLLCIYLSYLVSLTLSGREAGSRTSKINLEIFGTWSKSGTMSRHALENILLFIPFGILVPLKSNFFKKWWNLILSAFISSLSIELMQFFTGRGYFETDDILLNTAGAVLGYMVFWLVHKSYIAVKHETKLPLGRHEQQLNRVTLFAVQLLPVVLIIMMIFGFGSDDADRSAELSRFITEKILYIINKLFNLKWTAEKIQKAVPVYEGVVRKGAHITEFALLTFFTFVFWYCRKIKNSLAFIFTFCFTAVIAVLDEINQLHVDGRSGSFKDVIIDCLGSAIILFFILIMLSLARFYHWRRGGRDKKRRTNLNGSE